MQGAVEPGSRLRTDGHRAYRRLPALGYEHRVVVIANKNPSATSTELPGIHRVASLLKRWLFGTYHHGYGRRHLPYYLDEFTFRFNRRTSRKPGMLFYRLLQQAVATDPTRYATSSPQNQTYPTAFKQSRSSHDRPVPRG